MSYFAEASHQKSKTNTDSLKTTQRQFNQEAIDKLIYDVMASDQGLASLASGENLSGGYGSSSKTLLAQDFLTKIIGELAVLSSPLVEKGDSTVRNDDKKISGGAKGTVICTELARQGYLDPGLYETGGPPSRQISKTTWTGYHIWAVRVVERMKTSPRLCRFLLPIVESRYRYLIDPNTGVEFLGRLTVHIGHPICYLIGTAINLRGGYGRTSEFT